MGAAEWTGDQGEGGGVKADVNRLFPFVKRHMAMAAKTVTREHLYDAVYGAAGLSRAEAAAIVELVLRRKS